MTQKWFVSQGDRVYGPWSTEDVHAHRYQGNVTDGDLIWGEGHASWATLARWNPKAAAQPAPKAAVAPVAAAQPAIVVRPEPQMIIERPTAVTADAAETKLVNTKTTADSAITLGPADETADVTAVVRARPQNDAETVFSPAANETWHYAAEGKSFGPFNRPGLIIELRRLGSLEGVVLWTRGMREWAGIHEFHELALELGVSQRKFARATITGRAVLKIDGLTQMAPLASISEGGVGLRLNSEYFAGQTLSVEIQADALGAPITVDAEVRYCAQGIVGLKFISPSGAVRGRIASYVKRTPAAKAA